jgi:hypothetical protein
LRSSVFLACDIFSKRKEYRELSATLEQKVTARTAELQKEKNFLIKSGKNIVDLLRTNLRVLYGIQKQLDKRNL